MQITYDGNYHIKVEYPETEFHVGTDNIAEAKKIFYRIYDECV